MADSPQNRDQAQSSGGQSQETPVWETVVGAAGLLFVLAILGFLVYQGLQDTVPPEIVVSTDQVSPIEGGYRVEIRVRNLGSSTGVTVVVEGTLKDSSAPDAQPIETSQTTFDFVPAHATRQGGLFFTQDPAPYLLEVRAKGYTEP